MNKKINKADYAYFGILCSLTIIFSNLVYRQTIKYNGKYISDVFFYVKLRPSDREYTRAIATIFGWIKSATGSTVGIAIFMGIVITGVIVATYYLIKELLVTDGMLLGNEKKWLAQAASLIALFTSAIYLPHFYKHFYMRTFSKWAWHSPTQQFMVLMSIISLIAFFKIYENYMDKICLGWWITFAATSFASSWSKPSYMLIFTPTLALYLLIDLIRKSDYSFGHRLLRIIMLGSAVLPAGIYILYVNFMKFGGSSDGGGIAVDFGYFLNKSRHPIVMILLSIMFPLIVYCFNSKKLKEFRHQVIVIMFALGTAEYLTFVETGASAKYGNFGWSRSVALFIIFAAALSIFIANIQNKDFMKEKPKLRMLYFLGAGGALLLHLISGIVYFCIVLSGQSYEI